MNRVYDEFLKIIGKDDINLTDWEANKTSIKSGQKDNEFKRLLRNISNIFILLIPTIIAVDLFNGFLTCFAIYTGINVAKEFVATPALGGISIESNIITISTALGLYNADVPLNSTLTTGKGGIIGVWLLSKVEKGLRKVVPDMLYLILKPFLSILMVGTIYVLILMSIIGCISDGLI